MKSSTEFDFSREKHDPNYSTMDERLPKQELAKKTYPADGGGGVHVFPLLST